MDLEHIVKSNIQREWSLYRVTLPNIEWYCEAVFYSHEWVTMDYLSSNFSEKLSFSDIHSDIHHIFLMSSICGSIFLRIIDTDDLYDDTMIILNSWKLDTFTIREQTYFVLIYADNIDWLHYYTNFVDQPIFQANFENNEFIVSNTLTGMNIYTCSYYIPEESNNIGTIEKAYNEEQNRCIIMDDRLFPEKKEFQKVRDFLESHTNNTSISIEKSKITENSLSIQYNSIVSSKEPSDGKKLIWFLGTHQCILENPGNMSEYISLQELTDLDINMPQTFMPSGIIENLDPGWHKLRKTLMELEYMTQVIRVHIWALQWNIDSIDALNSPYLKLQKDHSTMTLTDLEKIEKTYTIYLDALIVLLQNSIT